MVSCTLDTPLISLERRVSNDSGSKVVDKWLLAKAIAHAVNAYDAAFPATYKSDHPLRELVLEYLDPAPCGIVELDEKKDNKK